MAPDCCPDRSPVAQSHLPVDHVPLGVLTACEIMTSAPRLSPFPFESVPHSKAEADAQGVSFGWSGALRPPASVWPSGRRVWIGRVLIGLPSATSVSTRAVAFLACACAHHSLWSLLFFV